LRDLWLACDVGNYILCVMVGPNCNFRY